MSAKPAARKGDPTADGDSNLIDSGSPDVLFDGLPAAREGDTTECGSELCDQLSLTVLINGKAAVMVDSEGSAGNVVMSGSRTVLIGDSPSKENSHTSLINLLASPPTQKQHDKLTEYLDSLMSPKPSPKPCQCSGTEVTQIYGYDSIPSYSGDIPSPFPLMPYVPEAHEAFKIYFPASEIRSWVRSAAEYHGIPHVLLAVIIQQENWPKAGTLLKIAQFVERTLTTISAITDELIFDLFPDRVSASSSGLANMSRATLRNAVKYIEFNYNKPPMPPEVQYRIFDYNQDTRIPGDDWKADLYYCAAHLRELIDRVTGQLCHNAKVDKVQLRDIISAYNGSGKDARKSGRDAIALLERADKGTDYLYFYEK